MCGQKIKHLHATNWSLNNLTVSFIFLFVCYKICTEDLKWVAVAVSFEFKLKLLNVLSQNPLFLFKSRHFLIPNFPNKLFRVIWVNLLGSFLLTFYLADIHFGTLVHVMPLARKKDKIQINCCYKGFLLGDLQSK